MGEIECALRGHAGVKAALVLVRSGEGGAKRLIAYILESSPVAPEVLQEHVRNLLPDYMIPQAFVTLEAFPLTVNGKVDREALPLPQTWGTSTNDYVAPRTALEERLASIWSQVLGLERVGVHDNFFECGGDSILSIQILSRAKRAGLSLTPQSIFEHPTIAALAGAVEQEVEEPRAEQSVVSGPVPLTPVQHWFFEKELPNPHHWNQAILLKLHQALEVSRSGKSPGTSPAPSRYFAFPVRPLPGRLASGNPSRFAPVSVVEADGRAWPEASRAQRIEERSAAVQAGLHLERGPLVGAALFRLGRFRTGPSAARDSPFGCRRRFLAHLAGGFAERLRTNPAEPAGGFAFENGIVESLVGRPASLRPLARRCGGSGVLGIGSALQWRGPARQPHGDEFGFFRTYDYGFAGTAGRRARCWKRFRGRTDADQRRAAVGVRDDDAELDGRPRGAAGFGGARPRAADSGRGYRPHGGLVHLHLSRGLDRAGRRGPGERFEIGEGTAAKRPPRRGWLRHAAVRFCRGRAFGTHSFVRKERCEFQLFRPASTARFWMGISGG